MPLNKTSDHIYFLSNFWHK